MGKTKNTCYLRHYIISYNALLMKLLYKHFPKNFEPNIIVITFYNRADRLEVLPKLFLSWSKQIPRFELSLMTKRSL